MLILMTDLYKFQQYYYLEMLNNNIFQYNKRHKDFYKIKFSFVNDKYYIDNKINFYESSKKRERDNF
jgi:hypothetical protein